MDLGLWNFSNGHLGNGQIPVILVKSDLSSGGNGIDVVHIGHIAFSSPSESQSAEGGSGNLMPPN